MAMSYRWDFVDLSLEVLGLESEDCKKKFVCMADNEALDNPFLQLFMQTIGYARSVAMLPTFTDLYALRKSSQWPEAP